MNCLRKSFVQLGLPAPVERVFSTGGLSMHPHSAHVGNKLLSELVMIKSNIKPQPVYYCVECKTHVSLTVMTDDSDSLLIWQWWCSTSTISVWWKLMSSNYMLLHFKMSEVFEIWVLVLCPRGVSPSLITILPRDRQCSSIWRLSDCCSHNALL